VKSENDFVENILEIFSILKAILSVMICVSHSPYIFHVAC